MVTKNPMAIVPSWLRGKFNPDDVTRVEEAIMQVEKATAGELVVALARRSSAVGHVGLMAGFGWALLGGEISWFYGASPLVATGVAIAFFACGLLAGRYSPLQRILTNPADMELQVFNAASAEFLRARVMHTSAATGVLIYVSFMEHRVVVLGDSGIASKVQQSDWDEIVATIISGIKSGKFGDGLVEAVHKAGTMLSVHFPTVAGTGDELHNAIRYLD